LENAFDALGKTGIGDAGKTLAGIPSQKFAAEDAGPVLEALVPKENPILGIEHQDSHWDFVQDIETRFGLAGS
jgi:hypothetical protein